MSDIDNSALGDELDYEKAIAELENIVAQMETGQLPLADALAQYQRGAALIKECHQALSSAEQKIQLLNTAQDSDGVLETVDSIDQ